MIRAYNAKQWEVRAILEGRKNTIRQICKDGNEYTVPDMDFYDATRRTYAVHNFADREHTEQLSTAERTCPICPGDTLYIRETWGTYNKNWWESDYFLYRADYPANATTCTHPDGMICNLPKWRRAIHMPKEAARIWLKVTDVRVERLQKITEDGAKAEGAIDNRGFIHSPGNEYDSIHTAREHFAEIWNSTIKKADLDCCGWDASPWVWVIDFERCEKPEDA